MNDMFRGCNEYEVHEKSIRDLQRELKRISSLFKPCCMVEDDNYHGTHCDNPAIDRVALDINNYVIKSGQIAIAHFNNGSSRTVFVEGVDLDNPTVNTPGCWVDTIDEDGITEGLMSYILEVIYEPVHPRAQN